MWAGVVYYVLYLYFSPYETVSHPNLPDLLFLPRTSRLIDIVKLICNGYFKYHTSLFHGDVHAIFGNRRACCC